MANAILISEQILTDTATAIKAKLGTSGTIKPVEFPSKIAQIPSGGTPVSGTKTITENGTYDVAAYASAVVNVPTSGGGSGYTVTWPGSLSNQSCSVEAVSQNVSGVYSLTVNTDRVVISLSPSVGYNAGTIVLNGNDTGQQNTSLVLTEDVTVTATPATARPASSYLMEAEMTVGTDGKGYYGFSLSEGYGNCRNNNVEYNPGWGTETRTMTEFKVNGFGNTYLYYNSAVNRSSSWAVYIGDGSTSDYYVLTTMQYGSVSEYWSTPEGLYEYLQSCCQSGNRVPVKIAVVSS